MSLEMINKINMRKSLPLLIIILLSIPFGFVCNKSKTNNEAVSSEIGFVKNKSEDDSAIVEIVVGMTESIANNNINFVKDKFLTKDVIRINNLVNPEMVDSAYNWRLNMIQNQFGDLIKDFNKNDFNIGLLTCKEWKSEKAPNNGNAPENINLILISLLLTDGEQAAIVDLHALMINNDAFLTGCASMIKDIKSHPFWNE